MAVMSGLNDASIFRLKLTWSRLSQPIRQVWSKVLSLSEAGGRGLSRVMLQVKPPLVPYIGIILKNVISFNECVQDRDNFAQMLKNVRQVDICILMLSASVDRNPSAVRAALSAHSVLDQTG